MEDWYRHWFGDEYLRMYPHRDGKDAEHLISLIDSHLHLEGRRVLDLACGPGRHAGRLKQRGASVTGLDLSETLLRVARSGENRSAADYVRGDMLAMPFVQGRFDGVTNLFTSFGYFPDDRMHEDVIHSVGRLLRNNGWFVIDFLNADHVRDNLVPETEQELGGRRVRITKDVTGDGKYVEKRMHVLDEGKEHLERVRLFSPDDLSTMINGAGMTVEHRFGDYSGNPISRESPRAVFFARK